MPKASLGSPGDTSRRPKAKRALTLAEFHSLTQCPKVQPWRQQLYRVAGLSGLRARELHLLTPADFTLGDRPRWHLRPQITKGKRLDVVPMLPECVELLTGLINGLEPVDRIFPRRPHSRTVARDFRNAGIARLDHRGLLASFHSLRYCFCTVLGSVLPIQTVRLLMRHRDIRTTLGIYMDLGIEDVAASLEKLPVLFAMPSRCQAPE